MNDNSTHTERRAKLSVAFAALLTFAVAPWGCGSATESTAAGGNGTTASGGLDHGGASGAHVGSGGMSVGGTGVGGTAVGGTSSGGTSAGGASESGGSTTGGAGNASGGTTTAGTSAGGASAGAAGGAPLNCGSTPPPVTFSKNIRLNDDTGSGNQSEVTMATGPNGLVAAGWMDSRASRVCAFAVSTDGGMTFGKNVSIPNATGQFVGDPAVAIDGGGTIYAVCQEYLNVDAGTGNVRLMTSTNRGQTWSAISTIQSAPDKPWAAGGVTDGTLFVSWLGKTAGIKRSLDHGATWDSTQSLGNIIHGTAIVTSNSGLVHVPYNLDSDRNQLRYLRSSDGGGKWDKARDLVADMGAFCFECSPRQHPIVGAASDPSGKTVAITWTSKMSGGEGDDDVWLLYSKDGGDTWTKPLRVNDNATASRQFQSWVAVDACQRVHVAWTDLRNGKNEVWYARSADPTKGFEPNIQVTDGSGSANTDFLGDYKGVAVLGSDLLIVWNDTRRDSGDIYFSRAVGAAGP